MLVKWQCTARRNYHDMVHRNRGITIAAVILQVVNGLLKTNSTVSHGQGKTHSGGKKKSQRDNQRLRFYIFFLLIITDGVFWHVLCFVSLWMKSCNHPTDALFLLAEVVRSVSLGVVIWPNHWHLPSPSWPLTWATACALARWPAIMKSTMAAGQCMCVSESPCAHECMCVCVSFSVSGF